MTSKDMFTLGFHISTAIMYFCAIVKFELLPPMPHRSSEELFAGRLKYLTYWNLLVQFLFFAASSVIDLKISTSASYYKLTRLRDKFFGGIVLPYGIFVFCMFWGLYTFDRELIFPRSMDSIFPAWLNHVSHTVLVPVLVLEMFLVKHRHSQRKQGIKYTLAFGLLYFVWILYLGVARNIWVYPVLQVLSWIFRSIFIAVSILVILFMYLIGENLNRRIWGPGVVLKSK